MLVLHNALLTFSRSPQLLPRRLGVQRYELYSKTQYPSQKYLYTLSSFYLIISYLHFQQTPKMQQVLRIIL